MMLRTTVSGALALGVAACAKPPQATRPPVAVTVARAERGPAPYVIEANGVVEPMQTVAVQSQVNGVLTSVKFREGDEVQEGQVLFEIDPLPYEAALRQAQAELARDEAQADNARRDAERYATLAQKDFVTRSQADQAASNAVALKAVVEAARANVASAQFNRDNATVRAPVSGKTGSLLVRQGNLVRAGANPPLVIINQIHPILVRFTVPDREFPVLMKYARAETLPVTVTPRGTVTATRGLLSFIDNGVDTTTGTVMLKGRFENRDGALWPGQFVAATLELYVDKDALLVPSTAVMNGQDGQFVFVLDKDGKAQMQTVTVGRTVADKTVIEQGLDPGVTVITDGQSKLAPGSKVDVKQ